MVGGGKGDDGKCAGEDGQRGRGRVWRHEGKAQARASVLPIRAEPLVVLGGTCRTLLPGPRGLFLTLHLSLLPSQGPILRHRIVSGISCGPR